MVKTLLDRGAALFLLGVLFVPVFIPLWLLIRATSKGDAIYGQPRVGKGCKAFILYKFRSMYQDADKQGYQTQDADPRITPVGRVLRKTSLDELPQLFNVLKGDMSLVGPRPDTPMQKSNYSEENWQLRHSVRPGITGLAQVNGRSNMGHEERLVYDLEYVRNKSLRLDLMILLRTLRAATGAGTN